MEIWAIVVAAGSGRRYGSYKQLELVGSKRVLDWAIDSMNRPDHTIAVVPQDLVGSIKLGGCQVVAGGATRSASVRAGLEALASSATHVLVHDGARPVVSAELVTRVIDGLAKADGVVPVVPVTDTLRRLDGTPVDRSEIVAVQTPQGFSVAALRAVHDREQEATDDAGLLSQAGYTVVHVAGEAANIKVTVPSDLKVAEGLLSGF